MNQDPRKHRLLVDLVLPLVLGGVYLATLLPGTGHHGDTAKFQFIGHTLGTPHATGYPVYILLSFLFTHLMPLGSLAWRANLLSAVCAVAACWILQRTLLRLKVMPVLALAVALACGLTPGLWSQAVVAEVYALNVLFVGAVVFCLLEWDRSGRDRWLTGAALLFGLSLGNHVSVIALIPGILLFLGLYGRAALRRPGLLLGVAGMLLLGLLPYAYLFWRTRHPGDALLEMTAPGWRVFWREFTGARFRGYMFAASASEVLRVRLPDVLAHLGRQWGPLLLAVPPGLAASPLRRYWALLLPPVAAYGVIVLVYSIPDAALYLIPVAWLLALPVAVGLDRLTRRFAAKRSGAWAGLWLLLPAIMAAAGWREADRSADTEDARRVEEVLALADRDAVIVAPGYHVAFYFRYYLLGEDLAGNNLYLIQQFDVAGVKAYLDGEGALPLPGLRRDVPTGLDLLVLDDRQVDALREVGCHAWQLAGKVFLVGASDAWDRWQERRDVGMPAEAVRPAHLLPVGDGIVRFAEGWGEVESMGRWIEAEEASLQIPVAALPGRLELTACSWGEPDREITVRARLDGREVGSFTVGGPPWQWQDYLLELPGVEGAGQAVLTLRVPRLYPAGPEDSRRLALPVRQVRLLAP